MPQYAIGLDFGTNSCRSLLVDISDGNEVGTVVFDYPSGELGILTDPKDPNVARQNPQDYLEGLEIIIRGALEQASQTIPGFKADEVIGIGVDTTGSTPIPVDQSGAPLALDPRFRDNLDANVWLWKDHTSHAEAAEITELAKNIRPEYLAKCGGIYSSEWWWAKILHLKRTAPDVFEAAHSFVEHCDYIPAVLSGSTDPTTLMRGVCAAGHKAMYSDSWDGLPDKEFLSALDPSMAQLRDRLYDKAYSAGDKAGELCEEWAEKTGLAVGTSISVGAFDCHMGAVACGVKEGTLTKILGTSTCDITVSSAEKELADIPGLCGIVNGSVLPGHYGIEAGQSAVGDIFLWLVHHLVPESYGNTPEEKFTNMEKAMADSAPGSSGLLALDWNNGNRTILVDTRLSGILLGQTLHTEAHEIYRAYIEATAFGALTIIRRMEEYGISINEVITTGGLAVKNATLMQIYADILGRPLKVASSDQTCALGAALFGASSSGVASLEKLQGNCAKVRDITYKPVPENQGTYERLYSLYLDLHDSFGTVTWEGQLDHVMKELINIREAQR
ncbi:MAG: ribulokinase [Verrucomicrobiales bacterium]|nr:ribulokinase [Verrucomicrobiales bacterium]